MRAAAEWTHRRCGAPAPRGALLELLLDLEEGIYFERIYAAELSLQLAVWHAAGRLRRLVTGEGAAAASDDAAAGVGARAGASVGAARTGSASRAGGASPAVVVGGVGAGGGAKERRKAEGKEGKAEAGRGGEAGAAARGDGRRGGKSRGGGGKAEAEKRDV